MAEFRNTIINDTGFLRLPIGITSQRPLPLSGAMRWNTNTAEIEYYNGVQWIDAITGDDVPTNSLALWLDAGQTRSYPAGGGTVWYDVTGNGRNATLVSSPGYSSEGSGSFLFNSTGPYIQLNTNRYQIVDGYTVSFWVKRISGTGVFLYIGQTGSAGMYFESYGNTDITTWSFGPSAAQSISWGNILSTTAWTHVTTVMVNSTKTQTRYINGVNIGSTVLANAITPPSNTGAWQIKSGFSNWASFVSSLYIYSKALSANEVYQNFNALRGRYGV